MDAGWIETIVEEARAEEPRSNVVQLPHTARGREEMGLVVDKFLWLTRWFQEACQEVNRNLAGDKFLVTPVDPQEIRNRGEGRLSVIFLDKRFQIYQVYIPTATRLQKPDRNFLSYGKLVLHNAKVPLGQTEYEMGLLPQNGDCHWMLIINDGELCRLDRLIQERLVEWLVCRDRWLTSIRLF